MLTDHFLPINDRSVPPMVLPVEDEGPEVDAGNEGSVLVVSHSLIGG